MNRRALLKESDACRLAKAAAKSGAEIVVRKDGVEIVIRPPRERAAPDLAPALAFEEDFRL